TVGSRAEARRGLKSAPQTYKLQKPAASRLASRTACPTCITLLSRRAVAPPSPSSPRDHGETPAALDGGDHCVHCGGVRRRIEGAFSCAAVGRRTQFHRRPGLASGVVRLLYRVEAARSNQDLRLPARWRSGGLRERPGAGAVGGLHLFRELPAREPAGAGRRERHDRGGGAWGGSEPWHYAWAARREPARP